MKTYEFKTINDVLDFAICEEQAAIDFYIKLAKSAANAAMKATFEDFAQEEASHKEKLVNIKNGKHFELTAGHIQDLKISDYTVPVNPSPDMTYAEALLLAMKKEKAAFRLYTHLAAKTPNNELKMIFLGLAQEESKHKLHFEIEYDDHVLNED